jgi:hypothetical protein
MLNREVCVSANGDGAHKDGNLRSVCQCAMVMELRNLGPCCAGSPRV